jgi:hypothetical protein
MPKIGIQPRGKEMLKKIKKIVEGTNIIKRQLELTHGHWDFVVFGPGKNNTIIRVGYAQHLRILTEPAYTIAVADPSNYSGAAYGNITPMPIEEFVSGDVPKELKGLDILNVDPLRPLTIETKKTVPKSKGEKFVEDNYSEKNIAIIQTPNEKYWAISVLKYLNECDQFFPNFLNEAIRKGNLPINARFLNQPPFRN